MRLSPFEKEEKWYKNEFVSSENFSTATHLFMSIKRLHASFSDDPQGIISIREKAFEKEEGGGEKVKRKGVCKTYLYECTYYYLQSLGNEPTNLSAIECARQREACWLDGTERALIDRYSLLYSFSPSFLTTVGLFLTNLALHVRNYSSLEPVKSLSLSSSLLLLLLFVLYFTRPLNQLASQSVKTRLKKKTQVERCSVFSASK